MAAAKSSPKQAVFDTEEKPRNERRDEAQECHDEAHDW